MTEEQKAQKAFGLCDTRAMLEKLRWEAGKLSTLERHNVVERQYHALNAAITAWHITDWLWHTMPAEVRVEWDNIQKFQEYVRQNSPMIRLCYQIATGSKHCIIERHPDPSVSAGMSGGEGYDYGNPIILDGDTRYLAQDVFFKALFWFEAFIHERKQCAEAPFVPRGDGA